METQSKTRITSKHMFVQVEIFQGSSEILSEKFNEWGLKHPGIRLIKIIYDDDTLIVFYQVGVQSPNISSKIKPKAT